MKTLFKTGNDLPKQTRTQIVALLNQSLADLSDLYSQTKQAHWNVRGRLFISLHKFFDELAETIEEHLDEIAERVTALGGIAQGTVRQAAANSRLKEFPTAQGDELGYVTALIERYAFSANETRAAINAADKSGDADTADLFTAVSRDLDKALWMLEAHTREV